MSIGIGDIANLLKLRIGFAIALSAVAGMAVTPGPSQPAWRMAVLVLAVLLCSGAAGAFNQYFERDLDARMKRTANRPFVRGRLVAGPGWLVAMGGLLAGGAVLALSLGKLVAVYVLLGAAVYGLVYTVWLKRRTTWNIVVGGLAGSFAVLAGAAMVNPVPSPLPVVLAMILFLWTPPHFWSLALARRDDYAAAGVPMLPVVLPPAAAARVILVHAVVLVAVSLLPSLFGLGLPYIACAAAGGAFFVVQCARLTFDPTAQRAMSAFFASLVQLMSVIGGVMVEAT